MDKTLKVEYEKFEDDGMTVLSVVDKRTVLNMFQDKEADEVYRLLTEDGMSLEQYLKEVRTKVIDEFAEKLKTELLEEIQDVSERQRNYEIRSAMSLTCSHIMGTLRDVHNRVVDKVAKQLKA